MDCMSCCMRWLATDGTIEDAKFPDGTNDQCSTSVRSAAQQGRRSSRRPVAAARLGAHYAAYRARAPAAPRRAGRRPPPRAARSATTHVIHSGKTENISSSIHFYARNENIGTFQRDPSRLCARVARSTETVPKEYRYNGSRDSSVPPPLVHESSAV